MIDSITAKSYSLIFFTPPPSTPESVRLFLQTVPSTNEGLAKKLSDIKRHAPLFSTKSIERALEIHDALELASTMLTAAKYYLATTKKQHTPLVYRALTSLFNTTVSIFETFITSFGLASFFKPAETDMEADQKIYKLTAVINSFGLLSPSFGFIIPAITGLIGNFLTMTLMATTFLTTTVLSFAFPYIKPTPILLPLGENYSKQLYDGVLQVEPGREMHHRKIAEILTRDKRPKHALLVGNPGVGKNELAKSFVAALAKGDYPALSGKTVFYFNTANFIKSGEGWGTSKNALKRINDAMGNNRKNIILIFDEIQSLCTEKTNDIGQKLLTLLDVQAEGFPYVIGITTTEQMKQIESNHRALASRFEKIPVESTHEEETLAILHRCYLQEPARAQLKDADKTIRELYQSVRTAFPTQSEPALSLKILRGALQRAGRYQKLPLETKVDQVRSQIDALNAQNSVQILNGHSKSELDTTLETTKRLISELSELEEKLKGQKELLAHLFSAKETLDRTHKSLFKTVLKVHKNRTGHYKNKFLLLNHFAGQLQSHIKNIAEKCEAFGIKTTIDSALIQTLIDEEKAI